MPLLRLTQIMIGLLLVLSTSLVGIGERSMAKTGIMLAAVCASFILTDLLGWIRLNRFVAGLLALCVMAYSLFDAFKLESQRQLEAIATLQTFLEVILLFQPKNPRLYWQLIVLSLGQVMVACALSIGLLFGAVLLLYAFVAIVTLTLLLLYREHSSIASREQAFQLGLDHPQDRGPSRNSLSQGAHRAAIQHAVAIPRLSSLRPVFGHATALTMLTLGVASLIFFLMPRFNTKAWQGTQEEPLRVVGFSQTVTLGALGAVVQDANVVMRVRLWEANGKKPYLFHGDPLLRGSVVTHYQKGRWTQPRSSRHQDEIPSQQPLVLQEISIEPLDEPVLFAVGPITLKDEDNRIRYNRDRRELVRSEEFRRERFDFLMGTTGIVNGQHVPIVPATPELDERQKASMLQRPLVDGIDPLQDLRAEAALVIAEANIGENDRIGKARALERYLRDSGKFGYSLEGQARDPSLDPLEDFITLHQVGHCEYFAGALTMMLRSQGIPARMVIGFKGGEFNSAGGYYQIRQLHAHTWVEAYLEPQHHQEREGDESKNGWWLLLDPTTASEDDSVNARGAGWFSGISHYFDYAQVLWGNYVVGLTAEKQEQSIYQPLAEAFTVAADSMLDREAWEERLSVSSNAGLSEVWNWYKQNWFNWRGGLAAIGGCLVMLLFAKFAVVLMRFVRWLVAVWRTRSTRKQGVVEFYARLEREIARHGLKRLPAQTQHEFAQAAGARLSEAPELAPLSALPATIVDLFYRVRFGRHPLDSAEAARVEHALSQLESARAK